MVSCHLILQKILLQVVSVCHPYAVFRFRQQLVAMVTELVAMVVFILCFSCRFLLSFAILFILNSIPGTSSTRALRGLKTLVQL